MAAGDASWAPHSSPLVTALRGVGARPEAEVEAEQVGGEMLAVGLGVDVVDGALGDTSQAWCRSEGSAMAVDAVLSVR